jgi:hypothetical protein
MTAPRRPQDRQQKASASKDGYFSFTKGDTTYTFPKPFSTVQSPAYLRQHRRRSDLDLTFTMIEDLADDDPDILKAIDSMSREEFNTLSTRLGKALEDSSDNPDVMGESAAS